MGMNGDVDNRPRTFSSTRLLTADIYLDVIGGSLKVRSLAPSAQLVDVCFLPN